MKVGNDSGWEWMQWDERLEARRSAIQYIPQSLAVGQLLEGGGC